MEILITDSIDKLPMSVRCNNFLRRQGIFTVSDLLNYKKDFHKVRGCGRKTLNEIANSLQITNHLLPITAHESMMKYLEKHTYCYYDECILINPENLSEDTLERILGILEYSEHKTECEK